MNATDERKHTLRERAEDWRKEGLIDPDAQRAVEAALATPWRSHSVIVQAVFFVLTVVGMAAAYGLLHLFSVPGKGVVAGIAFLAAAEFLIRSQHWFGTGVEAALWIGGLFGFISELPSTGKIEALLVIAAACALAGWRVRNPLFGAAAAILVMVYCEDKWDAGVVVALLFGAVSVLALLREWRRPTTEWLWTVMALVLPVAGWFTADARWRTTTIALYAMFGALAFGLALAKHHHALFLAAAAGFTIAAVEAAHRIAAPLEAKVAAGGAFLLVSSFLVHRILRERTAGLVVTPARLTPADDALAVAGALAATPHAEAAPAGEPLRAEGGGSFGGAGATGDY